MLKCPECRNYFRYQNLKGLEFQWKKHRVVLRYDFVAMHCCGETIWKGSDLPKMDELLERSLEEATAL